MLDQKSCTLAPWAKMATKPTPGDQEDQSNTLAALETKPEQRDDGHQHSERAHCQHARREELDHGVALCA